MSLVYKRPGRDCWYVRKTRQSTGTANRKLAEEFARRVLEESWRQDKRLEDHTWNELVAKWQDIKAHKRSLERDSFIAKDFTAFLERRRLIDPPLKDITHETLHDYAKQVKLRCAGKGRSSGMTTANLHSSILRAMLRKAHEYRWINDVPVFEMYKQPKRVVAVPTEDKINEFLCALPPWVAEIAHFARLTGLRLSNVLGLEWDWLHDDDTRLVVPAVATKPDDVYNLPLSASARALIKMLRARGLNKQYVFVNPENPNYRQKEIKFWWYKAQTETGIVFKFHALRHYWATRHLARGTPDRALMHLGGWKSTKMLGVYVKPTTEDLAKYV